MIIQETFTHEGRTFTRTYSDAGRYVVREGVSYNEAIDPAEIHREYTEGDKIDDDEGEEPTASEILGIILGEDET